MAEPYTSEDFQRMADMIRDRVVLVESGAEVIDAALRIAARVTEPGAIEARLRRWLEEDDDPNATDIAKVIRAALTGDQP